MWHSFPVSDGTTYYVWNDDSGNGTAYIKVLPKGAAYTTANTMPVVPFPPEIAALATALTEGLWAEGNTLPQADILECTPYA